MQVFSTIKDKPHAYRFNEFDNKLMFNPIEYAISQDGKTWFSCYDEPNLQGIYLYDIKLPVANPVDNLEKLGVQDGQTLTSTSYDIRDIALSFYAQTIDKNDSLLAFEALERFLMAREAFWVCFSNNPAKKYRVKAKPFSVPTEFDQGFIASGSFTDMNGIAESLGTTLNPFTFDEEVWGIGENIPFDKEQYTFNSGTFSVYNPSDVMIQPWYKHHYLKITLYCDGTPTIKNNTTGDSITYKKSLNSSQTFVLDGVNPYLDGTECDSDTDHGTINLQLGDNSFSVTGCTVKSISFDFTVLTF